MAGTSPSHGRRRGPSGLLVALTVALLFGGIAVGARAGGGAKDAPSSLDVPAPSVGDRWSYQAVLEGAWLTGPNDAIEVGQPFPYAELEWLEPRTILDGEGREVAVDVLNATLLDHIPDPDFADFNDGRLWFPRPMASFFAAGTVEPVAMEATAAMSGSWAGLSVPLAGGQEIGLRASEQMEGTGRFFGPFPAPCLARAAHQGATLDLGEPVEAEASCFPQASMDGPGDDGQPLRARGVDSLLGGPAVRLEGGNLTVWLSDRLPVPLQMRLVQGEATATVTLASWASGSRPLGTGLPAPAGAQAPPVRFAPRQPWGPDDGGVDHPFPASEAYQAATSAAGFPPLLEYLAAHPDAITAFLDYIETESGPVVERSWQFSLWDGEAAFSFIATQRALPGLPVPLPPTFERADALEWFVSNIAVDPAQAPARLPTAASLMDRWSAFARADGEDDRANGWGMALMCLGGCETPFSIAVAGRNATAFWRYGGIAQDLDGMVPAESTIVGSQLDVDAAGESLMLVRWTGHASAEATLGPLSGGGAIPQASDDDEGDGILVAAMGIDPAQGSAIGLAALLAGALYTFWPSLKHVAFAGLFSRTQEDRLLDNPTRRRLVELVEARPGIHFQELLRASGAKNGTLVHHLRKLAAAGLVAERRGNAYTCYFPPGRVPHVAAVEATKSAGAQQILEAIRRRPGASGKELSESLGLAAPTVHHHTQRLLASGLVTALRDGRSVRFHAHGAAPAVAQA